MKTKIIIGLILLALVAVLLVQNKQVVDYRIFFWRISVSQVILVPLILGAGFLVGFLAARLGLRRTG